jgi:deoxycytidylate deaminase
VGTNYTLPNGRVIHAEQDMIRKLKPVKGRPVKCNVLIVRYCYSDKENKQIVFRSSYPCANCIYSLFIQAREKGYLIKNIYYSTDHNTIQKQSMTSIIYDEKKYVTLNNLKRKNFYGIRKMSGITGVEYKLMNNIFSG